MPMPRRFAPWAVVLVALALGGCVQRNVERIGSEEAASLPAPPPPSAQPQRAATPEIAATSLTGRVEVAPELASAVPANATLYLIVRVAGRAGGAPLAVQQIRDPTFPHDFRITERDSMIEGTPLIGEMSISARLDQDGDAFTTSAGDLVGEFSPVVAGESDIVVRLREVAAGDGGS
jgi:hypothetical protein